MLVRTRFFFKFILQNLSKYYCKNMKGREEWFILFLIFFAFRNG